MTGFNEYELDVIAPFFDHGYYLSRYPDIASAKIDPVRHYCVTGWREGRDPSATFDTRYYLRENKDVAAAGINPFVHYIGGGRHEGRKPLPEMAGIRRQLSDAWSVVAARAGAKDGEPVLGAPRALDVDAVVAALASRVGQGEFVISVSHDDYALSHGGIQNIIGDERAEFRNRGVGYLHLCPARPIRWLADASNGEDFVFALRLDGEALGRANGTTLQQALRRLATTGARGMWVIHHLMSHSPELLQKLIETNSARAAFLDARLFRGMPELYPAAKRCHLLRCTGGELQCVWGLCVRKGAAASPGADPETSACNPSRTGGSFADRAGAVVSHEPG